MSDQNTTYTDQGIYTVTLTVTEGACSDQASQEVIVQLVLPLDFDMPNVFTPNGDNTNDVFSINPENAVALNMVITNRWGNVVFESDNVDAAWNGRVDNAGAECTEGTYFYQFTIVGEDGQIRKEHGFVQLVRDNP
jgi:gliding motility-associated-like protein